MAKIVSGTFVASAAAVPVDCGFIPDYVELFSALGGTELGFKFFRCLADKATSGQYGLLIGNDGAISANASAAAGIIPYDAVTMKALIAAPDGNGLKAATIYGSYQAAIDATLTPTARTTAVVGTVVRPTAANGFLYECTTSSGACLVDPTWPTKLGESVTDSATNVWICREERLKAVGGKGFTLGADISSNDEIWVYKAELHDRQADMGDADASSPVNFEGE